MEDSRFRHATRQKRGTAFASSEVEVVGKPEIRKWRHGPTHYAWKPFCPPLISALQLKISYISTSQVGSITLLLPERFLPARLQRYEKAMEMQKKGTVFL